MTARSSPCSLFAFDATTGALQNSQRPTPRGGVRLYDDELSALVFDFEFEVPQPWPAKFIPQLESAANGGAQPLVANRVASIESQSSSTLVQLDDHLVWQATTRHDRVRNLQLK
jgi:hypothetical protein